MSGAVVRQHLETLGLAVKCGSYFSQEIIKKAYKEAALQHHPDKNPGVTFCCSSYSFSSFPSAVCTNIEPCFSFARTQDEGATARFQAINEAFEKLRELGDPVSVYFQADAQKSGAGNASQTGFSTASAAAAAAAAAAAPGAEAKLAEELRARMMEAQRRAEEVVRQREEQRRQQRLREEAEER